MDELDSVVRCIELGAEDYLPKPFNPVLLRARIGASLEKKRLRDQQRELIRKFATSEVADELMASGFELGGKYVEATAMFSDIRGFTTITEAQSPAETIELLNTYYTLMFDAIGGHGGVVNQMVGDGLMAIFGAPVPRADHREQAVRPRWRWWSWWTCSTRSRRAAGSRADPHWRGHRLGPGDRRLHRHPAPRHLHLRGRHGQPGRAAGGAHQDGGRSRS